MVGIRQVFLVSCIFLCAFASVGCGGDEARSDTEQSTSTTPDATGDHESNDIEEPDNDDSCGVGELFCGGTCVDTQSNAEHCGGCDSACETPPNGVAICAEGGCRFHCEAGFADEDDDLGSAGGSGCEIECTPSNNSLEICDGRDNNCDGRIDEIFGTLGRDCTVGVGACERSGSYVCSDDHNGVVCDGTPGEPEAEVCGDGIDNNCDGQVDDGGASNAPTWFEDADGDGYGDGAAVLTQCDPPAGYVDQDGDCDGANASISPAADEVCDGMDNNCDDRVDEDEAVDASAWFKDVDGDGYGDETTVLTQCDPPTGYIAEGGDCDDTSAAISPAADEVCDSLDNNCDGRVDEDEATDAPTWFKDEDVDGYGDDSSTLASCSTPSGYTGQGGDCDDSNSAINPGADEVCDSADNNCDSRVDEDEAIDAPTWFEDADDDGFGDATTTRTSCSKPNNYVDNDDDCDDSQDVVYPNAPGLCDGLDNDCNGDVDEIRPITDNPTSVALTGDIGEDDSPHIMAVPAGADSFCVAHLTNNQIVFSYVDATASLQSATRSLNAGSYIMDIDWVKRVGQADGDCAALIGGAWLNPGTHELQGSLVLAQWSPGDTAIDLHDVSPFEEFAPPTPGILSAALYHVTESSNCSGSCPHNYWYAAFLEKNSSGGFRLVTARRQIELNSSSPFGHRIVVDSTLSSIVGVALGASPKSSDDLMIAWYSTSDLRWKIGTYAGLRSTSPANPAPVVRRVIFDSSYRLRNPDIHRVNTTLALGNFVTPNPGSYLTIFDESQSEIRINKINRDYVLSETRKLSTSDQREHVGRHLMAPNISRVSTGGRDHVGWYIDPFVDKLYRTKWYTGNVVCPVGSICSRLEADPLSNPNFNGGDEYLSIHTTGSYLQALRLIDTSPATVVMDELTCY